MTIFVDLPKEDLLDNKEASPTTSKGPYLARIIDLLTRGHNLQTLYLSFYRKSLFLTFMQQKSLTKALSSMRGVGNLYFTVLGCSPETLEAMLEGKRLECSLKDVISKVQSKPTEEPQSVSEQQPLLQRAQKQAREMLALVSRHQDLLARQREVEKVIEHHRTLKNEAEEKVSAIKVEVLATEADLERLTNSAKD